MAWAHQNGPYDWDISFNAATHSYRPYRGDPFGPPLVAVFDLKVGPNGVKSYQSGVGWEIKWKQNFMVNPADSLVGNPLTRKTLRICNNSCVTATPESVLAGGDPCTPQSHDSYRVSEFFDSELKDNGDGTVTLTLSAKKAAGAGFLPELGSMTARVCQKVPGGPSDCGKDIGCIPIPMAEACMGPRCGAATDGCGHTYPCDSCLATPGCGPGVRSGGQCVDTVRDPLNCDGVGIACKHEEHCVFSKCTGEPVELLRQGTVMGLTNGNRHSCPAGWHFVHIPDRNDGSTFFYGLSACELDMDTYVSKLPEGLLCGFGHNWYAPSPSCEGMRLSVNGPCPPGYSMQHFQDVGDGRTDVKYFGCVLSASRPVGTNDQRGLVCGLSHTEGDHNSCGNRTLTPNGACPAGYAYWGNYDHGAHGGQGMFACTKL